MRSSICGLVALIATTITAAAAEGDLIAGFEPGVYAKVYPDLELGFLRLPDGPSDLIHLEEIPDVELQLKDPLRNDFPSILVESEVLPLLGKPTTYAVEFEGWVLAEQSGIYTFSVATDDQADIYVEGKPLVVSPQRKEWRYFHDENKSPYGWKFDTYSGSAKLAAGRWYHVSIFAKQQYFEKRNYYSPGKDRSLSSAFNGTHFIARMQFGDEKAIPVPMYVPIVD